MVAFLCDQISSDCQIKHFRRWYFWNATVCKLQWCNTVMHLKALNVELGLGRCWTRYKSIISCSVLNVAHVLTLIFTLAASSGKRNVTVWRPSICPSICPIFFLTLIERGVYSAWLTRRQHVTRPAYIFSVRVLRGRTYSFYLRCVAYYQCVICLHTCRSLLLAFMSICLH